VKNENRFWTIKSTSFYSEFNADSEYVIRFKKYFGQKSGLTANCPLTINSTFYYPIQIFQSPVQLNIIVYIAGNSGVLEGAINNEQFVQIQTPKTENSTIFTAAPVMQFFVDQTILPSVVTFRLKTIQTGYSIRSFDITSNVIP